STLPLIWLTFLSALGWKPMSEAEWLACQDPDAMLEFLRGRARDRKLRLFGCACCRRIWNRIPEGCSRRAVEGSERYADSEASFEELEAAFGDADRLHTRPLSPGGSLELNALDAARLAAHPEMRGLADGTASAAAMAETWGGGDWRKSLSDEQNC